jgi:uncharacterized membrane protein YciS (DUF1049 family)
MKIKTIFIILLTATLTLALFQNSEVIAMKFLWMDFQISKLILMVAVFVVGLIVGLIWGAPKMKIEDEEMGNSVLEDEDKYWLSEDK